MHFVSLRIQGFRNLDWLEIAVPETSHFFCGGNGQGKTNLLESLHFVSALRSFRTSDNRALIGWNSGGETRMLFVLHREGSGESTVELTVGKGSRKLLLDGEPVRRLADYLGLFPTVPLSSQDIQLLRGGPQLRRRFMDMALASVDGVYFEHVRRYHQALAERNKLLRLKSADSLLNAFEVPMAAAATALFRMRREALQAIDNELRTAYMSICPQPEKPELCYKPDAEYETAEDFLEAIGQARSRDRRMETTSVGPHRDDFSLRLLDHRAREYASEGQQRSLVLALRLAQLAWIRERCGILPVLLADDILGELDADRQQAFWKTLDPQVQLFATGTQRPQHPGREWRHWHVGSGRISQGQEV